MNKNEKLVCEAIESMLQQDAKLGLSIHDVDDRERGSEYLHQSIDDMFTLKASDLVHASSVTRAFRKVHNYRYIDDPKFAKAVEQEMISTAVPAQEREKALEFIPKILDELKKEQEEWSEQDAGFNPNLDEVMEISDPEYNSEFEIKDVDGWSNEANVEWEEGDASPGHAE